MSFKKISRRKFFGQASCAAIGSATMLNSINNLSLMNKLVGASLTPPPDYKAVVCILLAGGNDSFNMLVPRGATEYAEYAATRADLAIPQADLLPINPLTTGGGKLFGVHPSMGGLQTLFEQGKAAFLANTGTLIEPIANESEYFSGNKDLPLGLYSHSDQIQQWQTAIPQTREAIGWGGRAADILKTQNTNQGISMNISLAGTNVWQSGNTIAAYSISNDGNGVEGIQSAVPWWYSNAGYLTRLRDGAVESMAEQIYANVFKQTFGSMTSQSLDTFEEFQNVMAGLPPFNTTFSSHYLSQDLRQIARVIAGREALGMCRQTFFTTFGGWDHHDELIENQLYMLGVLSAAISEFMSALAEIGMEDKVTLFTISDFARTLTSNGQGSDHAWGGNAIVAGGAVNGQEIYGSFPDLYLDDNPLVVSNRGNLIPTTSADEYFAELALWFGISPNDLSLVLPNIGNFYDVNSGVNPLGFLP